MNTKNTSTAERLLLAAAQVVARDGVKALTLDAVAAQAQVSKGGLLYHFPSKEALVTGMLGKLISSFEAAHASHLAADTAAAGSWTRAYVNATLDGSTDDMQLSGALVAVMALNPALMQPLQERYQSWLQQLSGDGIAEVDAHLVRLAVDGLWWSQLLGLGMPDPKLLAQLQARMIALAGPDQ